VKTLYNKFLFVFLFSAAANLFAAVSSPSIRCLAVQPDGSVIITWSVPPDPNNEFKNYIIYFSANGVTYTQITSINTYAQTTYTDVTVNANTGIMYYYMQTAWDDGSGTQLSLPSDTIKTIFLNVNNVVQGLAQLSWNAMHSPPVTGWANKYRIYKKQATTIWQLLDSVSLSTLNYTDSVNVCSEIIDYKIELSDSSGCISTSNISSKLFEDKTPPSIPFLDSVSVDTSTGQIVVGWQASTSGDTQGYIIAHFVNGGWALDTVWGINNTTYIDPSVFSGCEQYAVAAFDSCWKGTPPGPNTSPTGTIHKSIFVQGQLDECKREINLSWCAYSGWQQVVSQYELFVSENNNPYSSLGSISGSTLSFKHTNVNPGSTYCYFIRAYETGTLRTSSSNKICITYQQPAIPSFMYINYVTVIDDNNIEVSFFVDTSVVVNGYRVVRSASAAGPFETIETLPFSSSPVKIINDLNVDVQLQSYYYKIESLDNCSNPISFSNISKTIICTATSDKTNLINMISWDSYADWSASGSNIDKYNVYKSTDGKASFQIASTVSATTFNYNNDVSSELKSEGEFCYYVEAEEGNNNIYSFKERSRSNIVCVFQNPIIFIPDAFTPNGDGVNDVFKPISGFISNEYKFMVFNRWGEKVFETENTEAGWDGGLGNNLPSPDGVYLYRIFLKTKDGAEIDKRGTVIIMK
jgi:gliding motility-associated-like protein